MARKHTPSNYGDFRTANRYIRDSGLAPDPLSKLDNHGIVGKFIKNTIGKIISRPLNKISYDKHAPLLTR